MSQRTLERHLLGTGRTPQPDRQLLRVAAGAECQRRGNRFSGSGRVDLPLHQRASCQAGGRRLAGRRQSFKLPFVLGSSGQPRFPAEVRLWCQTPVSQLCLPGAGSCRSFLGRNRVSGPPPPSHQAPAVDQPWPRVTQDRNVQQITEDNG
ncbi:hypothetical protein P7K49_006482, partial [Saguinus oedipus]